MFITSSHSSAVSSGAARTVGYRSGRGHDIPICNSCRKPHRKRFSSHIGSFWRCHANLSFHLSFSSSFVSCSCGNFTSAAESVAARFFFWISFTILVVKQLSDIMHRSFLMMTYHPPTTLLLALMQVPNSACLTI